jgi:hypothetical protein
LKQNSNKAITIANPRPATFNINYNLIKYESQSVSTLM